MDGYNKFYWGKCNAFGSHCLSRVIIDAISILARLTVTASQVVKLITEFQTPSQHLYIYSVPLSDITCLNSSIPYQLLYK